MHTLGGLLHVDRRLPSMDYGGLLRTTLLLTKDQRQVEEAFRRMVFNVLSHNRDDHVKNFSFLMEQDGTWNLSPAYDLVHLEGPGGEHSMAVGGEGRHPGRADFLRVADDASISVARATEIIEKVRFAVARWPAYAGEMGVSWVSREHLARVLNRGAWR